MSYYGTIYDEDLGCIGFVMTTRGGDVVATYADPPSTDASA